MRLLLVNPWIADVSAYNFWVRPLGLYAVAEWASERGCDLALVDCLAPFPAPGRFRREPVATPQALRGFPRRFARYGISPPEFRTRVASAGSFDAVLMTSAMGYWYPGVVWAVRELRTLLPGIPILLGGVYPTLWPEHARRHSGADQVLAGPLEVRSDELAEALGLPREPARPRRPWWAFGLHDGAPWTAVRTARGCPYRCSY
ncbi:MAG: cobalamin B12-binding domain-containing protein, partial [Proteobacteria bacterium]|nr:cobalamin B12-binding domain-containing protein [Pseudomonadota bacterium]